jgi:hypothetical protein
MPGEPAFADLSGPRRRTQSRQQENRCTVSKASTWSTCPLPVVDSQDLDSWMIGRVYIASNRKAPCRCEIGRSLAP